MHKILPFVFIISFLSAQNPEFKKLVEVADLKYKVKSYKLAYLDYDKALKLVTPNVDSLAGIKISLDSRQKNLLLCLVKHLESAHYSGNSHQANMDADKVLSIDTANAEAKAIKTLAKYKAGDKAGACMELRSQQRKGSAMAGKIFEDCFCWSEGVLMYRDACSAHSLSKNAEALVYINKAIEILPDSVSYWVKKGQILSKLEKHADAVGMFSAVIKKDANNFEALYLRAASYLKMNKPDSAFKDLSECIKLNSYNYNAYYARAELCELMKEYQSAIYDYQQCIRLKPEIAELHYKIGLIKKDNIQDELGGCEEFIKAASMGFEEANPYAEECKHPKKKKKK